MTSFPSYAFAATDPQGLGRTVDRTLPDRYNDNINVKDWGAKGDGVTNDAAAIQAAIDYAWLNIPIVGGFVHGANIFFPAGTYNIASTPIRISQPTGVVTANLGINIIGAGRDVTIIKGNYSTGQVPQNAPGFLMYGTFISGALELPQVFRGMTVWNTSTVAYSGALFYLQGQALTIIDCRFVGVLACVYCGSGSFGGSIKNCIAECSGPSGTKGEAAIAPANSTTPGPLAGSCGFWVGQQYVVNCQAVGFDIGFAPCGDTNATGNTTFMIGNRATRCNWGYSPGYVAAGGNQSCQGLGMFSNQADRCLQGIRAYQMYESIVAANFIYRNYGPATPVTIFALNWTAGGGGTVTISSVGHNIGSAQYITITDSNGANSKFASVTIVDANHFSYAGPSSDTTTYAGGTWNYPCQQGIGNGAITNCTYAANVFNSLTIQGSFGFCLMPGFIARGFISALVMSMSAPGNWFITNDDTQSFGNIAIMQCPELTPFVKYSGLNKDPYLNRIYEVGYENTIIDGVPSSAAFGATITGGGAGRYKVRFDGTNWTRVA